jgi:transcriptional antiterminator NusG
MHSEPKLVFRLGDRIRIKAGPFASLTGKMEGINQSKSMLKVDVDIFGRRTAVKVSFREAEKLQFDPPEPPLTSRN